MKKNKNINKYSSGFTIVEALVAVMILSISVASMLSITASSSISARYARNDITANYLLQEVVDSIRNSRDTIAFQMRDYGGGWASFINKYSNCTGVNGCYIDMANFDPKGGSASEVIACGSTCTVMKYDASSTNSSFYNYTNGTNSIFTRKVLFENIDTDKVKVTATVTWKNDSSSVTKTRTLVTYLLDWQQ